MEFLWYGALYLLALVPLFILFYVWIQRRRANFALRYPNLTVVNEAVEKKRWRRHIPALIFLLAVTSMIIALARPIAIVPAGQAERTVILTIDVSASMLRADIHPSRLDAAKAAAIEFVHQQDPSVQIGVVAFSDTASLVQLPTTDHNQAINAIDSLAVQASTAIGSGMLVSLNAILQQNGLPALSASVQGNRVSTVSQGAQPAGVIVLLTDGQNNQGPSPLDIAHQAAQLGIRVYTVGIGTRYSSPSNPPARDELDEETLKQIADITNAQYFRAIDENALTTIYRNMRVQFNVRDVHMEITHGFTALAMILALLGTVASSHWFGGLP